MKIKKKGNYFVAYRDEDDLNNSMLNDKILIGDSLGKVSIKTGKFIGNTACIKVLTDYWKEVVGSEDNLFEHAVLNQIESELDETDYD